MDKGCFHEMLVFSLLKRRLIAETETRKEQMKRSQPLVSYTSDGKESVERKTKEARESGRVG